MSNGGRARSPGSWRWRERIRAPASSGRSCATRTARSTRADVRSRAWSTPARFLGLGVARESLHSPLTWTMGPPVGACRGLGQRLLHAVPARGRRPGRALRRGVRALRRGARYRHAAARDGWVGPVHAAGRDRARDRGFDGTEQRDAPDALRQHLPLLPQAPRRRVAASDPAGGVGVLRLRAELEAQRGRLTTR